MREIFGELTRWVEAHGAGFAPIEAERAGLAPVADDAPRIGGRVLVCGLGVEHWGQGFGTEAARAVIDFFFEEFAFEQLVSGARVANPASRNILEKCGFQWSGVELHRFEALGSSTPVDCFRLSRSVWSSGVLTVGSSTGTTSAGSTSRGNSARNPKISRLMIVSINTATRATSGARNSE